MTYDRFKSEDGLLKSVLNSLGSNAYPKVSAIAGSKINPDIDLLEIKNVSENQYTLIGYELKLMKFNKRSRGLGWDVFYKGVGQSLMYLKNGVHRAVLVLGFHVNVPNDEMIDKFFKWLLINKELLSKILGNYLSVGASLYTTSHFSPIIETNSEFYPPDEDTKFKREALFQKKFTFNKKLRGR